MKLLQDRGPYFPWKWVIGGPHFLLSVYLVVKMSERKPLVLVGSNVYESNSLKRNKLNTLLRSKADIALI